MKDMRKCDICYKYVHGDYMCGIKNDKEFIIFNREDFFYLSELRADPQA